MHSQTAIVHEILGVTVIMASLSSVSLYDREQAMRDQARVEPVLDLRWEELQDSASIHEGVAPYPILAELCLEE